MYHKNDHAEEIYFIQSGKIKLNIDVMLLFGNRMTEEPQDEEFSADSQNERNIPFIAYTSGSYFGDVDLFPINTTRSDESNLTFYSTLNRDSTAITGIDS